MDHDKHRRAEPPATPKSASETVKDADVKDDPEDCSDPICVCEPEPYWQEIAERLEREARAPK